MTGTTTEDSTAVIIEERTVPVPQEPGDHDRLSHYVDGVQLMAAIVEGVPCYALCGKHWLPSRDGEGFPICPECRVVYESLPD